MRLHRYIRLCALTAMATGFIVPESRGDMEIVRFFRDAGHRLQETSDLDPLVEAIGPARMVLLGESTHGTADYYHWRAKISRRLVEEKGFHFIAVEGDWEALYLVNRYVKHLDGRSNNSAREVLLSFDRWPRWMWANEETTEFVEWLRAHNGNLSEEERVGIYGIDLYGWGESVMALKEFLRTHLPESGADAATLLEPLADLDGDTDSFMRAAFREGFSGRDALETIAAKLEENSNVDEADRNAWLRAQQNLHVIKNAKRHLRATQDPELSSWNVRAGHFKQTARRLAEDGYGEGSRGIIWAHNTHIGDARATPMAAREEWNIGQLAREYWGDDDTFLVGFASHHGRVVAARQWGADPEIMRMPHAAQGSFEELAFNAGVTSRLYLFDERTTGGAWQRPRGHRAIGVVYQPFRDLDANYVPTVLPARYDAFIYFESTDPVTPLHP